ncbi:MAG TPA: hypothetical protein VGN17_10710 [Bryobacteraceae bacterium]|jgi:hypothetical protein
MENEHNLLIVGLPEAGKTSYIHAVDELLQNPPTDGSLKSYGFADDRSYLERDKKKYRGGERLEHTERNLQGPPPELWFEHPPTGQKGRLFLPDVSGEVFQDQWTDRRWTKSFQDALAKIRGALLFIRADTPASNQELLGKMAALPDDGNSPPVAFDPKKASAQVQLVDVLQFIAQRGQVSRPLKLCVLISAWDTVLKPANLQPKTPGPFLTREWPLLDQYLRSNADCFSSRIYGVSALGGTEDEMEALTALPPQDRVSIVEGDLSSKELTLPLRWLLDLS